MFCQNPCFCCPRSLGLQSGGAPKSMHRPNTCTFYLELNLMKKDLILTTILCILAAAASRLEYEYRVLH